MQIDWITVAAQIVNFLILVYLLKRFLYHPVMNAMARREQRITDQLDQAKQREQQAQLQAQRYQELERALDQHRETVIAETRERAEKERKARLEEVREEREELRRQWRAQVQREKADFLRTLKGEVADAVSAIVRRVLGDLADAQLERHLVECFLSRLESMQEEERRRFREAPGPATIVTVFKLGEEEQRRIASAVENTLGFEGDVRFQQSPELLFGVELRLAGHKLAWTAADYMGVLEQRMEKALAFSGETFAKEQPQEREHAGASRA